MKGKRWLLFPAIFALVLLASGFDGFFIRPKGMLLKMHLRAQHRDFWCWAAATEMISEYLGRRISQCDSVSYVTGAAWCTETCECESGWGPFFGAELEQMKDNWRHWDFKFKHLAGRLPWPDLTEEISRSRRPVFAAWSWVGGGGHVLVVNGYAQPSGRDLILPLIRRNYVLYKDPWPPDCEPSDGFFTCTEVSGGDEAVSTYAAFVDDGVHVWDNTLHLFINTVP
jgi:hypothetical protein